MRGTISPADWLLFEIKDVLCGVNVSQIFEIKKVNLSALKKIDSVICPYIFAGPDCFPIACLDPVPLFYSGEVTKFDLQATYDVIVLKEQAFLAFLVSKIIDVASFRFDELKPLPEIIRKVRFRESIVGIGYYQDTLFYVFDMGAAKQLLNPLEDKSVRDILEAAYASA